ncbi:MAG: ATP-binding cassette domain-containing protein [Acidobacteriaceae bacterium]|nr:ATP-binding cassette domain-containing protein [Acidobacteriaceae bacterium]
MADQETSAGSSVVLRFQDVSLRFDDVVALDHVSFAMEAGTTRVILGNAGSGKSTLLKAAIGLVKPDSGRIYLLGTDTTDLDEAHLFPLRSRVGVLFQEGGLFDSITVADNVAYPLVNSRVQKPDANVVEKKVTEALRFVELEKTMEKFPAELSGGMRRRVGIARAVVTDPPLVLYDSPTAGLDPITANTIMALIAKERDMANTANVIVTHRYQDGQLMANFRYTPDGGPLNLAHISKNGAQNGNARKTTFMVMREGKVVFEGDQAELEASQDAYVQKFVPKNP